MLMEAMQNQILYEKASIAFENNNHTLCQLLLLFLSFCNRSLLVLLLQLLIFYFFYGIFLLHVVLHEIIAIVIDFVYEELPAKTSQSAIYNSWKATRLPSSVINLISKKLP